MKTLHFSTGINAPVERVWQVMFAPDTYQLWTSVFAEGSHFKGTWEQGSQIHFLAPSGGGMVAEVAVNRLHEYLSLKHIGMIKDGVIDTESDEVKKWAPAYENYTFTASAHGTLLGVGLDTAEDWHDYMNETWPKALARLKELCETNQ